VRPHNGKKGKRRLLEGGNKREFKQRRGTNKTVFHTDQREIAGGNRVVKCGESRAQDRAGEGKVEFKGVRATLQKGGGIGGGEG